MSRPSHFSNPNLSRIPHLIRDIHRGHLAVPRFQRPFIWRPRQRRELFESIYHGEPIGSILVWRTGVHRLPCYAWHGPRADSTGDRRAAAEYVLDGHQRLTTLYSSLAAGHIASLEETPDIYTRMDSAPGELPDGGPVYFDLESESFVLVPTRRTPRATLLPLWIAFDAYAMDEFRSKLPESQERRTWYARSQRLVARLTDYTVPVIPLVTDDLEHAIRSFHRINSQGTTMAEVHMLSALTWSQDFDLTAALETVRESLDDAGWREVDLDVLLKMAKMLLGLDLYQADQSVVDALREQPDIVQDVAGAVQETARFLALPPQEYPTDFVVARHVLWPAAILGPKILPYKLQAVLLADGLRVLEQDIASRPPDEQTRERAQRHAMLQRWLWRTTLTQGFASANSTRLRQIQDQVHALARGGSLWEDTADDEAELRWQRRFDFRSSRSRLLALLMAALEPRDLDDQPVPAETLLAIHGNDAMVRLFSPARMGDDTDATAMAESPGNRLLMEPTRARALRKHLLQEPDRVSREFWRSHGFDEQARRAMVAGKWKRAIAERNRVLRTLEQNLAAGLSVSYARQRPDEDELAERAARERRDKRTQDAKLLGEQPNAEQMVRWFFRHYEDPANGVPWDDEDGYVYCFGGPYDAREILGDYFSDADEDQIADAVERIEDENTEWVEADLY